MTEGVAVRVFETHASVRRPCAAGRHDDTSGRPSAWSRRVPTTRSSCVVTIGGDPDWIARYLVGLPVRFEVLEPAAVRDEIRALARRMLEEHAAG